MLRQHGPAAIAAVLTALAGQGVEITPPFQRLASAVLCSIFSACDILNLGGTIYDLCAMADAKKAPGGVRKGALKAQGDLARFCGVRMVSALPAAVVCCGKHLKSSDPLVRLAAARALRDIVAGVRANIDLSIVMFSGTIE